MLFALGIWGSDDDSDPTFAHKRLFSHISQPFTFNYTPTQAVS